MRIVLENVKQRTLIPNADVLTLNTAPVELLPAPGSGKAWAPRSVLLQSAAGTAGAGGNVDLRYGTSTTNRFDANVGASSVFPTAGRTQREDVLGPLLLDDTNVNLRADAAITAATSDLEVIIVADKIAL